MIVPPPRKTRPDFRHGKVKGLKFGDFKAPDGYPNPYPEPYTPELPIPDHPIPLETLYQREGDTSTRDTPPLPWWERGLGGEGASSRASQRLVYQTNHESRAYVFRLERRSVATLSMPYPRYPWNDDGTLLAPPPESGLGGLAGDGSALPEGAAIRMTRHYLYLQNQIENYACDLRERRFTVRWNGRTHEHVLPPFGPEVAEEGGSHGEQEWTPAPGPEGVYYWPVCLDPVTVGNLGGAMNVEKQGDEPIFLTAMQGWLVRPTQEPPAIMFYEGPYVSHETLAYYHGPAKVYPGFDRKRIAMIAWWARPRLREYRVYDGDGRLIRTYATGSDRVHMAWGDHGNYIVGDSGYDWQHPGTMTVFFPDSGAIRPIGYHDNAYFGQKGTEHPHPAVSPDGTKVIYKATHMDRVHGLEIMMIRPPRAPSATTVADELGRDLVWTVTGVNSEITRFRIFQSAESGRGYRCIAEVEDPRSPVEKLQIQSDDYRHHWPIPEGLEGYFVVCSVEGSGLMSAPSNEATTYSGSTGVARPRRLFVRCEDMIADRPTAYLTPDGEAACWAVVRQMAIVPREGEAQPGDPQLRYDLPDGGPYTVYVRLRGWGVANFVALGALEAHTDSYVWGKLGVAKSGRLESTVRLDDGVRLDQMCFSSDPVFTPSAKGPLDLVPSAPRGLKVERAGEGEATTATLTWQAPPEPFVKEYHVYAVSGGDVPPVEPPDQTWRLCTVKQPRALDWNLPAGTIHYYISAAGWDMSESLLSHPVTLAG
ncbi:MAG: hypothetical protein HY332_23830 [Chloroflexi bacterium]|nr:hypothetical protein [Chloroflexota bacterium]